MSSEVSEETFWKRMIKKHWYVLIVYGIALIGLVIGVLLLLRRYIAFSTIGGYGSWTLDLFSLGTILQWIILLILWELLIVVLPFLVYCGIATAIIWYKILPEEDRQAIKMREKKGSTAKKAGGGGVGAGIFFFLVFMLVVYIDGNFWATFGSISYSYYIYAYLVGIMWVLIVLGIPGLIVGIIFLRKKWKEIPE